METKTSLKITYILAFFGDLTLSLIITTSIMYGVILGATPIENGFIGAAYGFSYLLMPAVMGWIGDKMPRKVSLLIASIGQFSIAGYFTFLVASIFDLMFGLVLMGVFYGFYWQSIEAYISEKTSHSEIEHKKGISSFCIAWSTGYMLGPLFAGILRDFNIKIAFILLMVFYGLIFCLIVFGLPGIKIQKENQKEEKMEHQVISSIENNLKPDNQGSVNNKLLLNILFAMLIYALMGRIALTYFTDYATRGLPEGLGWTGTLTGQILFCYGVGRTSYFLFGRNFKISLKTIQYSSLLTGILLIFIAFITNEFLIGTIFVIFGIFNGNIYLTSLELLMNQEKKAKGAKAGLFESAVGLGSAISPAISGYFAGIFITLPFFVFSGLVFFIFFINQFLNVKMEE